MNIPLLSLKSILSRPLSTLLSWLLMSFGVTIVVLILLVSAQLKNEISKNAQGIDLVVGAKGSPLQLILCNIFHVDFPTGNISLKEANNLSRNRYIESAIPMSLGDSYRGYRIVGTTKAYGDLYGAEIQSGQWFEEDMKAVVGANVANLLGLNLGSQFQSQHGMSEEGEEHEEQSIIVAGILAPSSTILDDLILVSIPSIWNVHEHEEEPGEHEGEIIDLPKLGIAVSQEQLEEEEITSILIKYRSPMAAVMLPRMVNEVGNFQAASPAYETARLFNIIGVGVDVVNIIGILIVVISAISVFIALLHSLKDRKYDIAIMRSMGATRRQIFVHVLMEGLLIAILGCISGLVLAHAAIGILAFYLEKLNLSWSFFVNDEVWVLTGGLIIGMLAAIIPAGLAYKTDISKTLSKA
ncbi:ABC transporter permease [Marinoscillum sp. MHG1-6]|uniref:ABC transporter permease n=1 Tax=Marinoscillum sp. MHG1-6 TaxID=2959627 RepID=UPI002157FD53|nr:FtsX-like permease family protein [Marinoscillum sp. MHG1-6]